MDRKFYNEDLERLLKENADEFKMSPSKKIWHGIYNDLHPGTRWPSIAMSLLFIFTLVIVGHLNTQQSQRSFLNDYQKGIELQKYIRTNGNVNIDNKPKVDISPRTTLFAQSFGSNQKRLITQKYKVNAKEANNFQENSWIPYVYKAKVNQMTSKSMPDGINNENKVPSFMVINKSEYFDNSSPDLPAENFVANTNRSIENLKKINNSPAFVSLSFTNEPGNNNIDNNNIDNNTLKESKTSVKNISNSSHISILKIRRNSKISWAYYLSPTLSYRSYSKHNDIDQNLAQQLSLSNIDLNRAVVHKPSVGLEAGTAMKYSLTKKLKFTSGFQVNYSAYAVQANNIHPIIANLLLYNDKTQSTYSVSSISYYGNGPGTAPVNLHNYSLQISIPVGFEYKLTGNEDIQLIAASSFQPSFVVANHAYILSTDKKNYITQSALTRQWNISTNFGTFVSFNSNKFNWQIGPQVRYQLLSSYHNVYQVREHYIDYGIRLGISKLFK